MVDTLGLLLAAVVHPADIQDRDGGSVGIGTPGGSLRPIASDLGRWGLRRQAGGTQWAKLVGGWSLELVRRPAGQHTFQVLPRRWVVERTFGWFNLQRRLSKDYEALCETTETWLYIAMTGLILRRLAQTRATF